MTDISIIIPCLNPDDKLLDVINSVINKGFNNIIVVNDGSSTEYDKYFNEIEKYTQCTVLKHNINLGKGRALKTAFNYFLNNYPNYKGVITVDADNQHDIEDIYKCALELKKNQNDLILGCRTFNQSDVPLRSKLGNNITKLVFKILCGIKVSDTQTGLRALSTKLVRQFLSIDGERYEYETNMLLETKKLNITIKEVPIKTIYIQKNASSHFNPFKDSIKIYLLILKFLYASLISCFVDIIIFNILVHSFKYLEDSINIFIATLTARVISSLINFCLNKNIVFKNKENIKPTMFKYYILATIQMGLSYIGVYLLSRLLHINTTVIKIVVDLLLFFISFQIQREWVFRNSKNSHKLI